MPNEVAEALIPVLADTFALYRATHLYHWNVTGPEFAALHKLLNDQYDDLFDAVDEIAEHICFGLGTPIPSDFHAKGDVRPDPAPSSTWREMLGILSDSHALALQTLLVAQTFAEQADDQATLNLLADRMAKHRKMRGMLVASLGN